MAICISLRTLKDIRTERNLIQEDLAEATGSCSRTIGRIERRERNPSLEMAIQLAHYLNMSVEEIFTLDDNNSSYQKAEE
jgi:putative transcriptional regulator